MYNRTYLYPVSLKRIAVILYRIYRMEVRENVELYQIRQLLAVAEYGSLSAAALSLHVSQPALTRSMQKLEREFDVTLFHMS